MDRNMANLVIWCVFSGFYYEYSWDCADFLCCLARIFVCFFGFLLGFLGDFIRNLQRHLCVVWFGFLLFFWASIGFEGYIFLCFFCRDFFFVEIFILIFMDSDISVLLLCWFFWYFGIICKGYYESNGVWLFGIITTQIKLISDKIC